MVVRFRYCYFDSEGSSYNAVVLSFLPLPLLNSLVDAPGRLKHEVVEGKSGEACDDITRGSSAVSKQQLDSVCESDRTALEQNVRHLVDK